jgi:hypothetical protein
LAAYLLVDGRRLYPLDYQRRRGQKKRFLD